jgi:hypothetical protein
MGSTAVHAMTLHNATDVTPVLQHTRHWPSTNALVFHCEVNLDRSRGECVPNGTYGLPEGVVRSLVPRTNLYRPPHNSL